MAADAAGADAAFTAWLAEQGGYVHPSLDLFRELPGGDRAAVAAADIAEGEQLLIVPVAATLHLDVPGAPDGAGG